uniref:Uncharacterized protein n=1 Tax=Avena sativa TaxID=4498 RepID=A0ACD5UXI5_AVESA
MGTAAGDYALVQQAMVPEAAATVWEAESVARRHGHPRVTPLHVASAILSTQAAGVLLGSSGRPLRHEDLQLSLEAALSHLPLACPFRAAPLELSNALVALLRRAQTLQQQRSAGGARVRRRSRWRQGAGVKVELEQLVASILDDPSVYRAVRAAQVKRKIIDQLNVNDFRGAGGQPPSSVSVGSLLDRPVTTNLSWHSGDYHGSEANTSEAFVVQAGDSTERTSASLPSWLKRHQDQQDASLPCRGTAFQMMQPSCGRQQRKFAELSAKNFKIMCDALAEQLRFQFQQHQDIIPGIASTVLWCRSGMPRRARSLTSSTTWLLFRGNDCNAKKTVAQELSKLIFGTCSTEVCLVSSGHTDNLAIKKRKMPCVMATLSQAILENPHRLVFIDGVNQLDYQTEIAIKSLIATGRIMAGGNGSCTLNLEDAVFVLSSDEGSTSRTLASFPPPLNRQIIKNTDNRNRKEDATSKEKGGVESSRPFSLDLNASALDVEQGEDNTVDNSKGFMSLVDGVFRFD